MRNKWKQQGLALVLTACLLLLPLSPALAAEDEGLSFDLDQIVVTATKTEKKLKDVPAAVEVVAKEDLEKKNIVTVDDALKGIGGFYMNKGKGLMDTTTNLTLRGFTEEKRVLVLVDGQPQGDGYTNGVLWTNMPTQNIERIEVIKGPASALYGSSAMGGVINIITKNKASKETVVKIGIGELGTETKAINHSGGVGNLDYFINYGKFSTDGYITNDKDLPGTATAYKYEGKNGADKENYGTKLVYKLNEKSKISLSADRGIYTYFRELKPDQGNYKTDNFAFTYDNKLTDNLDVNLKMQEKKRDSWYVSGTYSASKPPTYTHSANTTKTKDADLQFNWKWGSQDLLTFGYAYRGEQTEVQDEEKMTTPVTGMKLTKNFNDLDKYSYGKTETKSFYFQNEHKFNEKLTAFLGGRYDKWRAYDGKYKPAATSPVAPLNERDDNSFNGKMGLVYQATEKLTVKASAGEAFRVPTCYELYRTWKSSSGLTYTADPNLKPEKSKSYELSLDYQVDPTMLATFSYFNSDVKDLIQRVKVTNTESRWTNADKAKIKGYEIGLKKKINDNWNGFINYTYTDAKVTETADPSAQVRVGKQLDDVPKQLFNLGLDYKKGNWNGNITARYSSDPREDGEDGKFTTYQGYFVVDTKISYSPNQEYQISLSIDNLFDKKYYLYDLAPPRTVTLELTKKF